MPKKLFSKIEPEKTLSHKVEEQLRTAILDKVYLPGDRLPGEIELSQVFGVSRTAVREALQILSGRGLVEIRKGSGAYVIEMASAQVVDPLYTLLELKCGGESLHHIVELRSMIEPEIAMLAAGNRGEDDIRHLKSSLESMKKFQEQPGKMIPFDIQFHIDIAQATRNPIILIVMEPVYKLLGKFIASTYEFTPAPKLAIEKHKLLLDCIEKQDGSRAFEIMKLHMQDGHEHIDIYYKRHHQL